MYKYNVMDLVCIGFYFYEWGEKILKNEKNGIWNIFIIGIK